MVDWFQVIGKRVRKEYSCIRVLYNLFTFFFLVKGCLNQILPKNYIMNEICTFNKIKLYREHLK